MSARASSNASGATPGRLWPEYPSGNIYRLWDASDNMPDDTSADAMDGNARLWNSAPDLLAALERALSIREVSTGRRMPTCWTRDETRRSWEAWEADARAAIAKARGEGGAA